MILLEFEAAALFTSLPNPNRTWACFTEGRVDGLECVFRLSRIKFFFSNARAILS